MSFDWMTSYTPPGRKGTSDEARKEMIRRDLGSRAKLLKSLGRSRADTALRCRQNLDWEFEKLTPHGLGAEVDKIVESLFPEPAKKKK